MQEKLVPTTPAEAILAAPRVIAANVAATIKLFFMEGSYLIRDAKYASDPLTLIRY
jgi:hypothetical protein